MNPSTPKTSHQRTPRAAVAFAASVLLIAGAWQGARAQTAAAPVSAMSAPARNLAANMAGQVEYSRGVGFAQGPGQVPRTLGVGMTLQEGDRLTTAEGGTAIVKLQDGTRMTVRPNSELVLAQYKFRENAPDNSMVMQLVRGGLRAITGLISKNAPNAARIQTSTATIGIRGTDFDARVCRAGECGRESAAGGERARSNAVQASAKIVNSQGSLAAVDVNGQKRVLVDGGAVYPGELVETGAAARAVLAFRDDSRMTLGAQTSFKIDNFVFDNKNPSEGRFLVSLLKGSVRALTGLIAKANTRNVGFATSTATIGIRGTGFDMQCSDAGCAFFSWLNTIEVTPNGQSVAQALTQGNGVFLGQGGFRPLQTSPLEALPRPDGITINARELFSSNSIDESEEGLFVFVRNGHIEIASTREVLHLGRGEAGFAGLLGQTVRPDLIPRFLDFDRIPLPSVRNPLIGVLVGESGIRGPQCR